MCDGGHSATVTDKWTNQQPNK